jgi:hypothetical protein
MVIPARLANLWIGLSATGQIKVFNGWQSAAM